MKRRKEYTWIIATIGISVLLLFQLVLVSRLYQLKKEYFLQKRRFSWKDKAALFYGFVSEAALKSYFREENFKTPPLKKLDEMASALGKPTYELIKEVKLIEKTDTRKNKE